MLFQINDLDFYIIVVYFFLPFINHSKPRNYFFLRTNSLFEKVLTPKIFQHEAKFHQKQV
jgi:hypothetical protein